MPRKGSKKTSERKAAISARIFDTYLEQFKCNARASIVSNVFFLLHLLHHHLRHLANSTATTQQCKQWLHILDGLITATAAPIQLLTPLRPIIYSAAPDLKAAISAFSSVVQSMFELCEQLWMSAPPHTLGPIFVAVDAVRPIVEQLIATAQATRCYSKKGEAEEVGGAMMKDMTRMRNERDAIEAAWVNWPVVIRRKVMRSNNPVFAEVYANPKAWNGVSLWFDAPGADQSVLLCYQWMEADNQLFAVLDQVMPLCVIADCTAHQLLSSRSGFATIIYILIPLFLFKSAAHHHGPLSSDALS